jgi:hypothetical protein
MCDSAHMDARSMLMGEVTERQILLFRETYAEFSEVQATLEELSQQRKEGTSAPARAG